VRGLIYTVGFPLPPQDFQDFAIGTAILHGERYISQIGETFIINYKVKENDLDKRS